MIFCRQIVPYQKENDNLIKISSADLFGQIVIWNMNDGRIHQTSSITNHIQNRFHLNDGTSYTNGQTRLIDAFFLFKLYFVFSI